MKLVVITDTCGAGKPTTKDETEKHLDSHQYVCIDTDEVGINWWDYAGTDYEHKYSDDCLKEAVRRANGRDLIFDSDEAIRPQIEYNQWFRKNKGKGPLFIDNSDMSVEETAEKIISFITSLPK